MAESRAEDNSATAEGNVAPRIIVQGGAFSPDMKNHRNEEYKRATKEAAKEGHAVLMNGGTAVDAVEAAVRVLESNENFNAGRGAFLNNEREVECDAMIMEGGNLNTGAVMSGKYFLHPVSLAKKIMLESPHCALSGDGALTFARKKNFPIYDPNQLIPQEAKQQLNVSYENYLEWVEIYYGGLPLQKYTPPTLDTVSAVARDTNGIFACATSTGGIPGKWKGRVGDAPLIGCGGYANKNGSATCAGHGESIMKVTLARQVVDNMKDGQSAEESAKSALENMENDVKGRGGIIAIDRNGNYGKAFSDTLQMVWASIEGDTLTFGMEKDESKDEPLVPVLRD